LAVVPLLHSRYVIFACRSYWGWEVYCDRSILHWNCVGKTNMVSAVGLQH